MNPRPSGYERGGRRLRWLARVGIGPAQRPSCVDDIILSSALVGTRWCSSRCTTVVRNTARIRQRAAHRAALEANQAENKRELRIAIDIDIPDRLIRHLRRFGSSSGDISLRVLPMQQSDALHRVQRGTVDHCVIWSDPPASFDGDTDELLPVGIWCVIPADSPLAAGRSVPVEDLRGERLVTYRPDATTQSFYDQFLDALAVIEPVVEHVEGDDVQFEMCREITTAGGFTITSEADTAHLQNDVVALPFSPPLATRLMLCSPGEADHTLRRRILQHFRSTPLRPT